MTSPAAWHTDPTGKHDHRWWDGTKWTEHVADAGESKIDHLMPGDTPPAPTGDVPSPGASEPEVTAAGSTAVGDPGDTGDTGTDPGTGGLSGAWEGTATPDEGQPSWQQPGAADPNATAQQPAWQQGPGTGGYDQGGGGYDQSGQYGQQPAWDQGGQYAQTPSGGTDGVAIAALVVGILSLLTSWFVLGGLGGIIALVLGLVALGRIKRNRSGGRGMAITGVVTGVLSIIVAIVVVVLFVGVFGDAAADYEQCLENNSAEVCAERLEESFMDRFRNR